MAYVDPTIADFRARKPEFASVDDDVITYWLNDAHRFVDQSWMELDYGPALIAAAAHNMMRAGLLDTGSDDAGGADMDGVSSFKSGTFQIQFADAYAEQQAEGGWASTRYGQEYLYLLRRNRPSMGVTSPGHVPFCGYYPWPYGLR